jgi:hypothetical protein
MTDAATTTTTATDTWFAGFDDETKGYIQNKGLSTKTAQEAFAAASKFHREAEKMIGAPANELVRLPKEANSPEWKNVYQRLGVPADAKDYDFKDIKFTSGAELDATFTYTVRTNASTLNLTKEQASGMTRAFVQFLDKKNQDDLAQATATLAKEKADLKSNWGQNEAANMVIARNAASALGVKPETVAALEKTAGYAQVMEMFRQIGTKIGEDKFVQSGGGGGEKVMTREAAVARKKELMNDKAWTTRYLNGDTEAKRQMEALIRIETGVAA